MVAIFCLVILGTMFVGGLIFMLLEYLVSKEQHKH